MNIPCLVPIRGIRASSHRQEIKIDKTDVASRRSYYVQQELLVLKISWGQIVNEFENIVNNCAIFEDLAKEDRH